MLPSFRIKVIGIFPQGGISMHYHLARLVSLVHRAEVQELDMLTCRIPQSQGSVCRERCATHCCIDRARSKGPESRRVVSQSLFEDHVQVWKLGLIETSNRIRVGHTCIDLGTQTTHDLWMAELISVELGLALIIS